MANFDASEIPDVRVRLDNVMSGQTSYKAERTFPVPTLVEMTRRQSVEIIETMQGDTCIGFDGWFLEVGAHLTVQQGTVVTDRITQGCALVDGSELGTRGKSFSNGRLALATFRVKGPKCSNAVTKQEQIALGIAKAIADIRKDVQKKYYDIFEANVQANQDTTSFPEFGTATSGANRLAVDPAEWNFELLRKIELLASQNYFPEDHLIVNGTNFWFDKDIATYRALNDDQRDQNAVFGDSMITWDPRTMDKYLGRNSTFVINPDQFVFYNTAFWPELGMEQMVGGEKRTMMSITDPDWSWNLGGSLRPVRYHVEMEDVCDGASNLGSLTTDLLVNISLYGTVDIGPVGYTNPALRTEAPALAVTGVMEIVKEAPAPAA